MRQYFEAGTRWEDTFPLRSRDGTYRRFLSCALPICNEGGNIVRWFGTNTDVTEQMEAGEFEIIRYRCSANYATASHP